VQARARDATALYIERNGADGLAADAARFRLLAETDVLQLPEMEWLVDGLLPMGGSGLLYGPAGIGKSFLVQDLALTVASTATHWHGRAIRPGYFELTGSVIYIAAEGAHGLKRRLRAWREATSYTGPLAIRFLDRAVQLRTLDDPRALVAAVEAVADPDDFPDLVVLDTLSRCMAGADENSAKDASTVVASLDYLRAELGCCTLALHHTGVAESRERGSTAFRGAVDALLSLKETDGLLVLESDKVRDGPPLDPLRFRLMPEAGSMVLAAADPSANETRPLSRSAMALLHSLRDISTAEGCTCTEWQEASGTARRIFFVARKALLDRKLVEQRGTKYRLTPKGEMQGA